MELYEKDGKIAVLVSGGFGAGWSTWNCKELAYDRRVVEFWLSKEHDKKFLREIDDYGENDTKQKAKELFESWGYSHVYFGGFDDIRIVWVNRGVPFIIDEYDGNETLQMLDELPIIKFDLQEGTDGY